MAEHGYLEVNEFITYPFVVGSSFAMSGGTTFPKEAISDAGFTFGVNSQFEVGTHTMILEEVRIILSGPPNTCQLTFYADAPGTTSYRWVFSFPLDIEKGCTIQRDATATIDNIEDFNVGWGFITIGDLRRLSVLAVGTYTTTGAPELEPAQLQSLAGTSVSTISIGNVSRQCFPNCEVPSLTSDIFFHTEGLVGDIRVKEGYNTQILANVTSNILEIKAVLGAGEGEPCNDILISGPGEGGIAYDDGTTCSSCEGFIKSINGQRSESGRVQMSGGRGITITPVPLLNKITIQTDTAICEA